MSRDGVEHLQELLKHPVIEWDNISLRDVPKEQKEDVFASIIGKNPSKGPFEAILVQWIEHSQEGWSKQIFEALAKPHVDADLMKEYFRELQRQDRVPKEVKFFEAIEVTTLGPSKLQLILSFLSSVDCVQAHGSFSLAQTCGWELLCGYVSIFCSSAYCPITLWNIHNEENWELLQAIVRGLKIADTTSTPFLEQYLSTVVRVFEEEDTCNGRIQLGPRLDRCMWRDHLQLVAKFAPHLFLEKNESAGDTFLNHIFSYDEPKKHLKYRGNSELPFFVCRVMNCCFESVYIPNLQGRRPLRHILQNMMQFSLGCPVPDICPYYTSLCFHVVTTYPSAVFSCKDNPAEAKTEPHPLIRLVGVVVAVLTNIDYDSTKDDIEEIADVFLNHVTEECCNVVDPHDGNTALHNAIAMSKSTDDFHDLAYKMLTRLMTRQATFTRNHDGQLPIHVALEGCKAPWIIQKLLEVAPKVLEFRNPTSMLYPFQMIASSSAADDSTSTIYSLLRMAPHLVATALTEENTAFLQQTKFIEVSRLRLEIEREWMTGKLEAEDMRRKLLEQQHQTNYRKRKRLQEVKRMTEDIKRQSA